MRPQSSNGSVLITGKCFLYTLKLIPFSSARPSSASAYILLLLLFIVLVHQITYTHKIHCSDSNYSDSLQKSSLPQALITVLWLRDFKCCRAYIKWSKPLNSSHKQKETQIFWNMVAIMQNVCISFVEMKNKEEAFSLTSITDSLDAISCRIFSIQNKPVKS